MERSPSFLLTLVTGGAAVLNLRPQTSAFTLLMRHLQEDSISGEKFLASAAQDWARGFLSH
jgi:hypothetical protein